MENEVIYEQKGLTSSVLGKTFFWMFMGLLATGIISWIAYASDWVLNLNFSTLALLELAVVFLFSLFFRKLSATIVTCLYFIYAIINGLTMSVIFYVYELNSIVTLFLVTAGMFGALAYVGMKTEKDITNWGTTLFALLTAGLILTLINFIFKNTMLDIILDWAILILFGAITIYDVNKIKRMEENEIMEPDKLYIYGAMEIYLDFINIFLRILALFAKRKN